MKLLGVRLFKYREIGEPVFLRRWVLLGFPWGGGLYLHQFIRSDHDRALHDHPWSFLVLVLWGGYWEVVGLRNCLPHSKHVERIWRRPFSLRYCPAEHRHRVELPLIVNEQEGWEKNIPSWSLVFVGPRQRRWGFWVPDAKGWTHWCHWRRYDLTKAICADFDLYEEGED